LWTLRVKNSVNFTTLFNKKVSLTAAKRKMSRSLNLTFNLI
jgi:hypothetical protein